MHTSYSSLNFTVKILFKSIEMKCFILKMEQNVHFQYRSPLLKSVKFVGKLLKYKHKILNFVIFFFILSFRSKKEHLSALKNILITPKLFSKFYWVYIVPEKRSDWKTAIFLFNIWRLKMCILNFKTIDLKHS